MFSFSLLVTAAIAAERTAEMSKNGWKQHPTPVLASDLVRFTIVLEQTNLDAVKRTALAVSTPGHAEYGRFLSAKQLDALTAPAPAHVAAVTTWLEGADVAYTRTRELLHVSTTVGAASTLLSTSFATYTDVDGRAIVRAAAYSLPPAVDEAVSTIFGLHGLPLPMEKPLHAAPGVAKVTPSVIAKTYSMGTPYVNRNGTNRQAVAEFQGQRMDKADLSEMFKNEVPTAQPGDDAVSKFAGGEGYVQGYGVEALLDIEFMMGVSPGVKTEFWSYPSMDFCADLHVTGERAFKPTDVVSRRRATPFAPPNLCRPCRHGHLAVRPVFG